MTVGYRISVDQKSLNDMRKRLHPDVYRKEVDVMRGRWARQIAKVARKGAPRDTGKLIRSIRVLKPRRIGDRYAVTATAAHASAVHDGTRPHMPPVSAIAGWARRHGLEAWPVALGIAKRGTKAQPFLRDAIHSVRRNAQDEVRLGMRRMEATFTRGF